MNANSPIQATGYSDEIDLIELFRSLWAQKILILLVSLGVGAIGAAYAYLATPEFEAQSMLRPADIKDFDDINQTGVYKITPEEALSRVGAALDSYATRMDFFAQNKSLFEGLRANDGDIDQAFEAFNEKQFTLLQQDPKKTNALTPFVGIKLVYPHPLKGEIILNGIVQQAIRSERQRVSDDLASVVENRLLQLERKMNAARASYKANKDAIIAKLSEADNLKRAKLQDELVALRAELRTRRQNRITQLEEAIRIAGELGISKPTTPSALGQTADSGQGNVFRTEVFNQQFPLHFMGTEALEAERNTLLKRRSDDHVEPRISKIRSELQLLEHNREIESLKNRKNEDLFLAQLAEIREEQARLASINLDFSNLDLVRIDQPAIQPAKPIKPKKVLIMSLGLILGGMLGVFIALIRGMLAKRRESVV